MNNSPERDEATRGQTTDVRLASSVARDVELDRILLRSAKLESFVGDETKPAKLETKQHLRARYEQIDPTRLHVLVDFHFELWTAGNSSPLVKVESEYLVIYRLPDGKSYSEDALRYFSELNGVVHLWPYWRELVHTVVARVGLGSLTLPVFRVTAKPVTIEVTPEE